MTDAAGVRLDDGRLIFVEGAPCDIPMGAQARIVLDGEERIGTVSVAPPHLIWRDPAARCAAFLRLERTPDPPAVSSAPPVEGLFLAEHETPDDTTMAAMLGLAVEESALLDT